MYMIVRFCSLNKMMLLTKSLDEVFKAFPEIRRKAENHLNFIERRTSNIWSEVNFANLFLNRKVVLKNG